MYVCVLMSSDVVHMECYIYPMYEHMYIYVKRHLNVLVTQLYEYENRTVSNMTIPFATDILSSLYLQGDRKYSQSFPPRRGPKSCGNFPTCIDRISFMSYIYGIAGRSEAAYTSQPTNIVQDREHLQHYIDTLRMKIC